MNKLKDLHDPHISLQIDSIKKEYKLTDLDYQHVRHAVCEEYCNECCCSDVPENCLLFQMKIKELLNNV